MKPGQTYWTPAELATLKDMCLRQRPFEEIVAALPGRTYNACVGKASRMDLSNHRCRQMQATRGYVASTNQRQGRS